MLSISNKLSKRKNTTTLKPNPKKKPKKNNKTKKNKKIFTKKIEKSQKK